MRLLERGAVATDARFALLTRILGQQIVQHRLDVDEVGRVCGDALGEHRVGVVVVLISVFLFAVLEVLL